MRTAPHRPLLETPAFVQSSPNEAIGNIADMLPTSLCSGSLFLGMSNHDQLGDANKLPALAFETCVVTPRMTISGKTIALNRS